ncbi:Gfo/Idh/MocA family protein [Microbacterium sp. OR16]|uniref:Gfo/Idh/MocA family protein n=1 Tax=Microbacterium sp. OR16 TaxID=3095345 RepID=UPI0039B5736D
MTAPVLTMPAPRTTPLRGGPALRWGVVAPGGIAADFVHALHAHTDQRVIAVASRSVDRARSFARRHDIARVHDDYAGLYDDEQVQIVYIAAPHSEHRRLAIDAIAAGKHVLIEKPIGLSADEAREVAAAAGAAGVFAMEAMWTRFLPQTDVMLHLLEDGIIGDPRLLLADLGFAADPADGGRLFDPALGGGALLDLGVYPVWLSHLWLGTPTAVTAVGTLTDSGVDQQSALVLDYASGAQALLSTSIRVTSPGAASISGSDGSVQIDPSFVFPGGFSAQRGDARGRFVDESGLGHREGMAWQAVSVAEHIDDGLLESPLHPLRTSIEVVTIIDEARRQLSRTR